MFLSFPLHKKRQTFRSFSFISAISFIKKSFIRHPYVTKILYLSSIKIKSVPLLRNENFTYRTRRRQRAPHASHFHGKTFK